MAYRKTPKVLEHLEALRARFIEATLEDIAAVGAANINVKSTAKRAGIPVGSVYRLFPDAGELVAAAIRQRRNMDIALMRMAEGPFAGVRAVNEALTVLFLRLNPPTLARALFDDGSYRIAIRDELAKILLANAPAPKDRAPIYAAGALGLLVGIACTGKAAPETAPAAVSMALRAMGFVAKVPA